MRVLHVLNYGWPYIDGYTVRSQGLLGAQRQHLGLDARVAVSPFPPFDKATDRAFSTESWGPRAQVRPGAVPPGRQWVQALERPGVGLAPWTAARFQKALRRLIRRIRPELVHAHHPHYVGRAALKAARAEGVPFVYEVRCFNGDYDLDRRPAAAWRRPYYQARGRWRNALERRLLHRADAVVTISSALAERMAEARGGSDAGVFVVRNSVNASFFANAPAGSSDEKDSSDDAATLSVGYATTFAGFEGLDLFVRSAARVRDALRGDGPGGQKEKGLRVTLAGTGPEWERIRALVEELDLEDVVRLPGFVPYSQMPRFYRGLDLFVVPRRRTRTTRGTPPLKPLEALAAGVPVAASDLPALRGLLAGSEGVRFFEPTVSSLAALLRSFAEAPRPDVCLDPDRTWQSEVHRYARVYEEAAARFSSGRPHRRSAAHA